MNNNEPINYEELLKKSLESEIGEYYNNHLTSIILNQEACKVLSDLQDDSFFGKLKIGWKLFYYSYRDWLDVMMDEIFVEEFFDFLGVWNHD